MMTSSFTFLKHDFDTAELLPYVENIERLYAERHYTSEIVEIRKVLEAIARQILDLNYVHIDKRTSFNDCLYELKVRQLVPSNINNRFHEWKNVGNENAHELQNETKERGLAGLKGLFEILVWYMNHIINPDKQVNPSFAEPKLEINYQTNERRLIYIVDVNTDEGGLDRYKGSEKIGQATINDLEANLSPNSDALRNAAYKRISQYLTTSGLPYTVQWAQLAYRNTDNSWFSDHDVHEVLERSGIKRNEKLNGQEWFKTDVETGKKAIQAVKDGRKSITQVIDETEAEYKITLRPEQAEAVKKTTKTFKKKDKMLWNAKMRFGKTITTLQLVKEQNYQKVLIMTHRPIVDDSWFEDFKKMHMDQAGYSYGSKKKGETIENLVASDQPFVYFASLQDLRGSSQAGGKAGDKNEEVFDTKWDLVVIDEAHEGTQTDLAQNVLNLVVTDNYTKLLELSGTPFNILDQYEDDEVFVWDYVMEQQAKEKWTLEHPGEPNPYAGLPKVSMYTFEMNKKFSDLQFMDSTKSFNFKEFFRVDDNGKFKYEAKVKQFLDNITSFSKDTAYPFSTREFRDNLRHTLWIMPGVKEANALEDLLKTHNVFGEYDIINVVRDDKSDNVQDATQSDVDRVNQAITDDPTATKTITLTVRKMTTGVTIKPWTGVVFLSNTDSAMQYLQAAFRAQTPYSSEKFGVKTNCYIFDFAPDRALKVMAESRRINTGVGKLNSKQQNESMGELMNFLPIIGEQGQGMKPFDVDSLITKLKRVYAEKAVRTGFDDDSLYSDQLLMLDEADVTEFNNLKQITGTTKAEKKPAKIDVNHQGLDEEEYEQALDAEKKPKRQRTPEEQAALDKYKELKKQRKTMISILRSISIRIPLMIYGMEADLDEDISIQKFVRNVDDVSWQEFMPDKVTKKLFLKFSKYYDQEVFIEAGKIIRNRVKELDNLDPLERAQELAQIFGTFRNPDKETVLTPWRVVNMHLGKTIGGLSFYDDKYENSTADGLAAQHWIKTDYTDQIFQRDKHILEINSKTGLYPLYGAMSMYYLEYQKLNDETAGKFTFEDELMLMQRILRENIFVIAKTPMAAKITKRTLAGYRDDWEQDLNIQYIENIVEDTKSGVKEEADKIKGVFGNMKFDVVIGNPPYQEVVGKNDSDNGQKAVTNIFQYFQELADELSDKYSILIYPGKRWIHQSGKGLKNFGYKQINDPHLKKIIYYSNANDVFKDVTIPDGISIVLKSYGKNTQEFEYEYIENGNDYTSNIKSPGKDLIMINPRDTDISNKLERTVQLNSFDFINNSSVLNRALFKIESDFAENNPNKVKLLTNSNKNSIDYDKSIKLFTNDKSGKAGRATWFIADKDVITVNQDIVNKWKVIVSSANAGGQKRSNQIEIIDNHSAFGRSRIALKAFDTKKEAENFFKYATSNVIRFAFLLTDENLTSLGKKVPDLLDYSDGNGYIDFENDVDPQLQNLFGLSDSQMDYIKQRVNNLRDN